MSIRVFEDQKSYVGCATSLPVVSGTVFCVSYLPVCCFSKDTVATYYGSLNAHEGDQMLVDRLWDYSKRQRRAARTRSLKFVVEANALRRFCDNGVVHSATERTTVTYATRYLALEMMVELTEASSLWITKGPVPYVFRLQPPDVVLLDVQNNVLEQRIQGVLLQDLGAFRSFQAEADRLAQDSHDQVSVAAELRRAAVDFRAGRQHRWGLKQRYDVA